VLTGSKQHRCDGEVQLVDEARAQVLADRCHSAAQSDVLAPRGLGERQPARARHPQWCRGPSLVVSAQEGTRSVRRERVKFSPSVDGQ
jgi:hypothetical protein